MLIGFSTGCLYKTHERLSADTIRMFGELGCNAIELVCAFPEQIPQILKLTKEDFARFEYISIHAPSFDKMSQAKISDILEIFKLFAAKITLNAVVLHPDGIKNWETLKKYKLPFMIENMDKDKLQYKNVFDFKELFEKVDFGMVLDLNHCKTNDGSMKLANDFIAEFGNKIKHIHLSGWQYLHDPLFETKQVEILTAIPDKKLPIIIESVVDNVEQAKLEFEYVKNYLNGDSK